MVQGVELEEGVKEATRYIRTDRQTCQFYFVMDRASSRTKQMDRKADRKSGRKEERKAD